MPSKRYVDGVYIDVDFFQRSDHNLCMNMDRHVLLLGSSGRHTELEQNEQVGRYGSDRGAKHTHSDVDQPSSRDLRHVFNLVQKNKDLSSHNRTNYVTVIIKTTQLKFTQLTSNLEESPCPWYSAS